MNQTQKYFILLFLLCTLKMQAQTTKYHPINALYPKKTLQIADIENLGIYNSWDLLKHIVKEFETSENSKIAILYNGDFRLCLKGNGQFLNRERKNLLDSIPVFAIQRIDAKYDPNVQLVNREVEYIGTINLILPEYLAEIGKDTSYIANPEPWEDPMTDRLLTLVDEQKTRKQRMVFATPRVHVGVFAGLMARRESRYVGIPIEVPLNKKLSLQAEAMYNVYADTSSYLNQIGQRLVANYTLQAFEASLLLKYYLNPRYFRVYLTAGPYVEQARNKWTFGFTSPNPEVIKDKLTAFGISVGIGMQFKKGLFIHIGISHTFGDRDFLLQLQKLRGPSATIGFRFGKP
jgi:hypothetical protein